MSLVWWSQDKANSGKRTQNASPRSLLTCKQMLQVSAIKTVPQQYFNLLTKLSLRSLFMYLVAIAWMYVVLMMSVAEAASPNGTLLGAFTTLLFYGALPLGIVLYIMGTPGRKRARRAQEAAQAQASSVQPDASGHAAPGVTGEGAGPAADAPVRKEG
jgi:hypothetical protein